VTTYTVGQTLYSSGWWQNGTAPCMTIFTPFLPLSGDADYHSNDKRPITVTFSNHGSIALGIRDLRTIFGLDKTCDGFYI